MGMGCFYREMAQKLLTLLKTYHYAFILCSGLIVWCLIVSALERTVSHFEHSSVACGTWCSVEDSWPTYPTPIHFGMSVGVILVHLMLRQFCWWGLICV